MTNVNGQDHYCVNCNDRKPVEKFIKDARYKSGLGSWCYDCRNDRRRTEYDSLSDPEKEKVRAAQRAYREANKDRLREYDDKRRLPKTYGITPETYNIMVRVQEGRCAICGTDEPGHYGKLVVDHDHKTGAVRGLLCAACNIGIGKLQDSIFCLESAIAYLNAKTDWRS